MPIRLRLTLWYELLLAATLLVFCTSLYLTLQESLERDFDQILRVRAAQVERELTSEAQDDLELTPDEIKPGDLEPDTLEDFAEPGVYVQVVSRRGEVLATSGTLLPVNPALLAQAIDPGTPESFETVDLAGRRFRTLYWPVRERQQAIAVVQVGETLQTFEETLADTRNLMVRAALLVLVAAFGGGWLLMRSALNPLVAITEAALHIAKTGRFDRRLTPTRPRDELGALAATFDLMIARVEQIIGHQHQFVANTSHELRNPLGVIRGNLDFARRVSTDPACLQALYEAEVEAVRMSRLVNDLLLLAQADADGFLVLRRVRLDILARDVAEQIRPLAGDRSFEVTALAEPLVLADTDRMRQAISNLVDNAFRHTPIGGKVRVTVRSMEDEAILEVSDNGPGVPAGHETRIFERFYRADPSRSRSTGGAGLGPAIVKHIVEAHGGHVGLTNRPGRGATFAVSLPSAMSTETRGRERLPRVQPDWYLPPRASPAAD